MCLRGDYPIAIKNSIHVSVFIFLVRMAPVWKGVRKEPETDEVLDEFNGIRAKLAQQARSHGTEFALNSAVDQLKDLLQKGKTLADIRNIRQVLKEMSILLLWKSDDLCRSWSEPLCDSPQAMFIMTDITTGDRYLGRHLLSQHWINNEIPEVFCSEKFPRMIMGKFKLAEYRDHPTCPSIYFEYQPVSSEAINTVWELPDVGFEHPWSISVSGSELTSPPEGWDINPHTATTLGNGEIFIRKDTEAFLSQFSMEGKVVYDPACSTGQFLSDIKRKYPGCTTVGQDLSLKMCEYARNSGGVDQVIHGDAISSSLPEESADFAFIRFLNSEVVPREAVQKLLAAITRRVKTGGYVVVFGHTPVLVSATHFRLSGLEIQRCSLKTPAGGRYQYYICVKQ